MPTYRPAAVAGSFYPRDPGALQAEVDRYLSEAAPGPAPKAIIAPHAGYVYSGPVAASAYGRVASLRGTVTRVVLAGPCHRVAVRGLALSSADAFETPLGRVPVDRAACDQVVGLPQVSTVDATHAQEHSLEVQLPFLQRTLGAVSVVPLVVGEAADAEVAEVLEALWGGPETLVVISTDLSHFLDYRAARALDAQTCEAIEALDGEGLAHRTACGRVLVRGLLALARRRRLRVETLDLRSSGDTAGDRARVVGYGAWAFYEEAA